MVRLTISTSVVETTTKNDHDPNAIVSISALNTKAKMRGFLNSNGYNVNASCTLKTLKNFIRENEYRLTLFPLCEIFTEAERKALHQRYLEQCGTIEGLEIRTRSEIIDFGICFSENQTSYYLNINNEMFWALVGIFRTSQLINFLNFKLPDGLSETQVVAATVHATLGGRLKYTRQI